MCFVPEIHPAAPAYVTQSVYIVKVTPVVRERNKTSQRLSKAGDFVTKGTTIHFYRPCSQKLLTSSHQHTPSLLEGKLSEDKYLNSFLAMDFGKQVLEVFGNKLTKLRRCINLVVSFWSKNHGQKSFFFRKANLEQKKSAMKTFEIEIAPPPTPAP